MSSSTIYIYSAVYSRAYAQVSGKRTGFYGSLANLRMSYLNTFISSMVPKSVDEVAEVRSLFPHFLGESPCLQQISR